MLDVVGRSFGAAPTESEVVVVVRMPTATTQPVKRRCITCTGDNDEDVSRHPFETLALGVVRLLNAWRVQTKFLAANSAGASFSSLIASTSHRVVVLQCVLAAQCPGVQASLRLEAMLMTYVYNDNGEHTKTIVHTNYGLETNDAEPAAARVLSERDVAPTARNFAYAVAIEVARLLLLANDYAHSQRPTLSPDEQAKLPSAARTA